MDITTEEQLRALIGSPTEVVVSKIANRLNVLTRRYIERSPFLCLATSAPAGSCEVSPGVTRPVSCGFSMIIRC